jgi:hypothetical protein
MTSPPLATATIVPAPRARSHHGKCVTARGHSEKFLVVEKVSAPSANDLMNRA